MLGWHLGQGSVYAHSGWDATSAWGQALRIAKKTCSESQQALTFGPGRPGCPVFPLKPWGESRELPSPSPQPEASPTIRPRVKPSRPTHRGSELHQLSVGHLPAPSSPLQLNLLEVP